MSDTQEHFDLELPAALTGALGQAYRHHPAVPPRVNDVILAAAHEKFDRRRRLKLRVRWGAAVSTAAAAAIVVVVWLLPARTPTQNNQLATQTIKGDIDASGRLDIVDAMTLARHLRSGDAPNPAWDANGDAKVDQRDVDALAAAAVNLKQQGLAAARLPSISELGLNRLPNAIPIQRDIALLHAETEERQ